MANERARILRKNLTPQEVKLWAKLRELRKLGHHFRRQAPIKQYILDFVCFESRMAIEVDGGHHGCVAAQAADVRRDNFLREEGFTVFRLWNNEVDTNLDGVLERIMEQLSTPTPARFARRPSPQGGGMTSSLRRVAPNDEG
jgi:very-short-patch-repair endonuclease